jgi:hypothetical protein
MRDEVDLEQKIMQIWSTKEDLMLFFKAYGDFPEKMDEDEVMNTILGIASMHELRCQDLWNAYKRQFKLDEWSFLRDQA